MAALVGQDKIVNSVLTNTPIKVLDPACGTGGFLVYLMQDAIQKINKKTENREITKATCDTAIDRLHKEVFFGSDANEGVAASAKMNMIIAGDGHTNIRHEDSLTKAATNWSHIKPDCSLILTNPPFGTSEADSLTSEDKVQFNMASTKGQHLFLRKMIDCTIPGGEICTVIDEGVLNTESSQALREYILRTCRVRAVVSLPPETFKPNKINVRTSLLFLEKRKNDDDFEDRYKITVARLYSLGYHGSGDKIRGFQFDRLINETETRILDQSKENCRRGKYLEAHDVNSQDIYADLTHRLDFKYWETTVRTKVKSLVDSGHPDIKSLNTIRTMRGKSPSADSYVDAVEGYAIVIKAGNIDKFGALQIENADWIEKSLFEEYVDSVKEANKEAFVLHKNDVLLASTGDGTLGKCCVFDLDIPAIPDGHVTVIRVNAQRVSPHYLSDYLRLGLGSEQINRLYTGSTGLIELTPDQIDGIIVDLKGSLCEQNQVSRGVRQIETNYKKMLKEADSLLLARKSALQ
jgi:type I restriction enzyme M protein